MAQTVTATSLPALLVFDLGNSNVATKVNLPSLGHMKVTLWFDTNDGKLAYAGTDGQAIDGTTYLPITHDAYAEVTVGAAPGLGVPAASALYLASATATTRVRVQVEAAS